MGEAKRRGSKEVRIKQSITKEENRLRTIELQKQIRRAEEYKAYNIMVWWQLDMSDQRHNLIMKNRHRSRLNLLAMTNMFNTVLYQSSFGARLA